jgi:hypothetical protein
MADALKPQFYKDYSSGLISNVGQNLLPKNASRIIVNMDADQQIGALTTRLGTGIVGDTLVAGKSILGVHHHNPAQGTGKLLAVINDATPTNADIWDVGADAISKADDTKDLKARFLTYLGETLRLNGTNTPTAWNGSSWITTGGAFDLGDMPTGHKYAVEFLSRVYVAGKTTEPNRVEYSGIPASGAVAWSSPVDFVDIEPEDNGGNIMALAKVPNYLVVLKERTMHRWNFYNAFPEQLIDIGTSSTESVVQGHGLVAFFSASSEDTTGFYITNGNRPIPISHDRVRNIKKWVDAIDPAMYDDIAGWGTDRVFGWSVGNVTVDGVTYSNAVLRWNRILDQWTVRTYPFRFTCFTPYTASSTTKVVGGTDLGYVVQLDKPATYTDYSAKPIPVTVATHFDKFNYNQLKTISSKAIIDCANLASVTVEIVTDTGEKMMAYGQGNKVLTLIKEMLWAKKLTGHKFSVIVRGEVAGAQGVLHEIELPSIVVSMNY